MHVQSRLLSERRVWLWHRLHALLGQHVHGHGRSVDVHALPGQQGLISNFGPSLAGAGARWCKEQLTQWVVDARRIHPQTLMPPFGASTGLQRVSGTQTVLTPDQIQQVVNTLAKWQ